MIVLIIAAACAALSIAATVLVHAAARNADRGRPAASRRQLVDACREELMMLWSDLENTIRDARSGTWSARCDGLRNRIKTLSDLVGPTPWQNISTPFLISEAYARVCDQIGHPVQATEQELAEIRAGWGAEVYGLWGDEIKPWKR